MGENRAANYKMVAVNGKKYWAEPPSGNISGWDWSLPLNHFAIWKIPIPVGMVKFPRKATTPGNSPQPVDNWLQVTSDFRGNVYDAPGFDVAWAKASVKAIAPIFLVHGTDADQKTWNDPNGNIWDPPSNKSFNNYFSTFTGICFNDIALTPNGAIDNNGNDLEDLIKKRLASVGAKACHIVAHSKGGIDSRAMIYDHYGHHRNESLGQLGNFEVLSLLDRKSVV